MSDKNQIVIYQSSQGDVQIDVRLEGENVWLNQAQIAQLFGKARSTISEHIKNIFAKNQMTKNHSPGVTSPPGGLRRVSDADTLRTISARWIPAFKCPLPIGLALVLKK